MHGATGPGKAWSARDQGAYLFELVGRKPFFLQVPVALMDGIIGFLDFLVRFFPALEARPLGPVMPGTHARLHAMCLTRTLHVEVYTVIFFTRRCMISILAARTCHAPACA